MTGYSDADAQRIADRGREALLERLRPAFHETARQHSDILKLDDAQLEAMIERAADRADGLQWRRALASVATEELGMSLGEALTAPVVARAQELAGAPGYEEALAELGLQPVRGGAANGEARAPEAPPEPPDPAAGKASVADAEREEPVASDELAAAGEAPDADEDEDEEDEDEDDLPSQPKPLRLTATHLGGIATLEAGEQNLELRIGAHGLDIARKPGRVLGRLRWREIRLLEAQQPRGLRRRRRPDRAQLLIRTQHGNATFEVTEMTEAELQASLVPLIERYARR